MEWLGDWSIGLLSVKTTKPRTELNRTHLEADVVAGLVDHLARLPELRQRLGDEGLPAKARVNGHEEDDVDLVQAVPVVVVVGGGREGVRKVGQGRVRGGLVSRSIVRLQIDQRRRGRQGQAVDRSISRSSRWTAANCSERAGRALIGRSSRCAAANHSSEEAKTYLLGVVEGGQNIIRKGQNTIRKGQNVLGVVEGGGGVEHQPGLAALGLDQLGGFVRGGGGGGLAKMAEIS